MIGLIGFYSTGALPNRIGFGGLPTIIVIRSPKVVLAVI